MRPHIGVSSRLPSALRFLASCSSMTVDDIFLHFERHVGGLLPRRQLRAAVTRLLKDEVRVGTLILRNRRYAVRSPWPSHRCSLCDLAKPLQPRPAQRRAKGDNRRPQQQQASPVDELWNQPDAVNDDHVAEGDLSTISSNKDSLNNVSPEPSSTTDQKSQ